MTTQNKVFKYKINGNLVEIEKRYRNKTQYEYYLTVFMGESDFESIVDYQEVHLTKKSAIQEAEKATMIKPKIVRVF